jgi:hypothetical protein
VLRDGNARGGIPLELRSRLSRYGITSRCVQAPKAQVSFQLPHKPNPSIPRGGANTSDHVDILGSTGLNEIILQVATGVGDEIQDRFVSDIQEYAKKVLWDSDD